jgi:hypothetical protein
MLTHAQKVTLKAAIEADPTWQSIFLSGNGQALFDYSNAVSVPAFWAWRTSVSRAEIYTQQNDLAVPVDDQFWNWTTYKNQGVSEQNAWVQMFMNDEANFTRQNLRDGIGKIFTGSAAATAQRNHVLAIGRRMATRFERVFATGTGTTALPGTAVLEGPVSQADLNDLVNV